MTFKVVDNTFISACMGEIECVDLLDISSKHYDIITSHVIFVETNNGFEEDMVKEAYDSIDLVETKYTQYEELKEWLINRYPRLHEGEITAFLLALLNYAIMGMDYYYVTDDNLMKDIIRNLHNDHIFMSKLGMEFDMKNFNVTGTVGFTRRLIEKGHLNDNYIEPILTDMDKNGFYLNEAVKNHLRGL